MTVRSCVALAGAFPPPVHGFSLINERLGQLLAARADEVLLLRTSPRRAPGALYPVEKLWCGLRVLWGILRQPGRRRTLVIGLDGDAGLWLNLVEAWLARCLGRRLFLYHHSAGSLAAATRPMRALTARPLTGATHVMCSAAMAERFRTVYRWRGDLLVVGNLAYVEPVAATPRRLRSGRVTLGFLSGLMRAKGVLLAVEALRAALERGVDARLLLAGPPVEADTDAELERAAAELGDRLILLGRVDGASKERFFAEADLFLFPTLYRHETQSLVVPEAMAAAIPVIAYAHHFVAESLPRGWPGLIEPKRPFGPAAGDLIARWSADPALYAGLSAAAVAHFAALKADAAGQLEVLLQALAAS